MGQHQRRGGPQIEMYIYIYIFVYSEHVLSIQLLGYQRLDPRPREVPDLTMDVTQWPMDV